MCTTAELWLILRTSVYHQLCMKALTALCKAERPISNGLRNNCRNSLTVSLYTRSISLLRWKHLCLMSHLINVSLLKYCMKLFCCYKQAKIINFVWLLCVEIADTKAEVLTKCWYKQKIILIIFPLTDVSSFHLLYCCYCYFYHCCHCGYWYCSCSSFAMSSLLSLLFVFASYTNYHITIQLYCYKPVTH
jgi:hypothetical protein